MFKAPNTDLWGPVPRQVSSRNWGSPRDLVLWFSAFLVAQKICPMEQI
jgi:hypothetical protein